MKFSIIPSIATLDGSFEEDSQRESYNWIMNSDLYNSEYEDKNTDFIFTPMVITPKGVEVVEDYTPVITPKHELPASKPVKIPNKDTKGNSTIAFEDYIPKPLDRKKFVEDWTNRYIQRGVNPGVAKIIAVQNLLETKSREGDYYSELAGRYHNYGGVKYTGKLNNDGSYVVFGSDEEYNGVKKREDSAFRVFSNEDAYADYMVDLLRRRYDLRLGESYTEDEYLNSLMGNNRSGRAWATASNYADTIRSMAKRFKSGGILKLQSGSKIDRVNGDYIHQFPKLWDILTYSGISGVTGNTLDYIATMPKVDAEVLTPILLRLEDYLSRNNKRSWEDLTSNEKYNLISLSSNLNKLDFSKGFTNGLDDDFRYLQGLVSRVSNDELDSLLNMDLLPTTIKEGIQLLKNKPKSIKLLDIKRVANIFNKKYDAGLDTSLIGLKRGGRLKYATSPNDKIDYLTEKLKKGGRIEKASLGTIFSTDKPRGQGRPGVGVLKNDYYGEDMYDYSNSPVIPKDGDHWPSRGDGILLKNGNHPTSFHEYEQSKERGLSLYEDRNGREYTLEEWQVNMPEYLLKGLKKKPYPSYSDDRSHYSYIDKNYNRIKYMWDELLSAGASPEQAAAILGNFYQESKLDYSTVRKGNGARGLAQLLGGRKAAYEEYLSLNPDLVDSTETQIKYLIPIIFGNESNPHGLKNLYRYDIKKGVTKYLPYDSYGIEWNKSQRSAFRNAKTLDDMVVAFENNFERANGDSMDIRKLAARYIYKIMNK